MSSAPDLEFIPQCDPRAGYLAQRKDIDSAMAAALAGGRYILGPEVEAFEFEFAHYLDAGHAIGVANGTDALELALRSVGIGPGDAVATVSHSAVATAVAIRACGAVPLFVDVDPVHGLMDVAQLELLFERASGGPAWERIRAVVPVHLYGRCADMPSILGVARRHGAFVVEDCAQAHGARFEGKAAGTFGDAGSFSFYPTKNLGAIGDGGAVVCRDASTAQRIGLLRQYGWQQRYVSSVEGTNSRLDELQAAILRVKLRQLDTDNRARSRIASSYRSRIRHSLVEMPPAEPDDGRHVYHQFAIRVEERDALQEHLRSNGVGSLVHYPMPIHRQPAYASPEYSLLPLPNTEALAGRVLSLPIYPQLPDDGLDRVCSAIAAWRAGTA